MTDDSQDLIVYVSYWMRFPGGSSSPPLPYFSAPQSPQVTKGLSTVATEISDGGDEIEYAL